MLDAILLPIGEGITSSTRSLTVDRRAGRQDLPGRPRTDEAEHQRHRPGAAEVPGRAGEADRIQPTGAVGKARRRRCVPRGLRRRDQGRQRDARRHPAADRRGKSRARADQRRQSARTGRDRLQGRPSAHEGSRQWRPRLAAGADRLCHSLRQRRLDRDDGQGLGGRPDSRMADAAEVKPQRVGEGGRRHRRRRLVRRGEAALRQGHVGGRVRKDGRESRGRPRRSPTRSPPAI